MTKISHNNKSLVSKYTSQPRLTKAFVWFSVVLVLLVALVYAHYLNSAFDTTQTQCDNDSMMSYDCENPYGSALMWTVIIVYMFGWPLFTIWGIMGVMILQRRNKAAAHSVKAKTKTSD